MPPTTPATLEILRAPHLASLDWLVHGFSTRLGGFSQAYGGHALNLGFTRDDRREDVERNRAAFRQALGAADWPLAWLRQVHSDLIRPVPDPLDFHTAALFVRRSPLEPRHAPLPGDGLITAQPGVLLTVRTADCHPLLLVDVKRRAVAVLHAGWRGALKRIAEKGVGEMRRMFGSLPGDLRAAIGPGIHACCYEVGEEVREQFHSQFACADALFTVTKESDPIRERYPLMFLVQRAPGHIEPHLPVKIRLDLTAANRRQLLAAGVQARHIWASSLCTACRSDLLFSHRAQRGVTGRMMAAIGIR